jgi:hypothetical protein
MVFEQIPHHETNDFIIIGATITHKSDHGDFVAADAAAHPLYQLADPLSHDVGYGGQSGLPKWASPFLAIIKN